MIELTAKTTLNKRRRLRALLGVVTLVAGLPSSVGCHVWDRIGPGPHDTTASYHDHVGLSIEYPEVAECETPVTAAAESTTAPHALEDPSKLPALELSLEEAIQMAMRNSPVIRSLGASVISPQPTTTVYDPGLVAASPQGVEAALATYDAQYSNLLNWGKTDRPQSFVFRDQDTGEINPAFPGVNDNNTARFQSQLQKRTVTGATFSIRHIVDYTRFNVGAEAQRFNSIFAGSIEGEYRQPLLRGAGVQYNRIVGDAQFPGQYNGVLIARINEDVALADFENAVVTLLADVEQAYWDLATAYRLLEAFIKGRESALRTYQYQKVRLEVGAGRQDEEAQAQSQYYQFQASVQNQLGGPNGLYALEQRLRYLLGMPASDGKLIKPTTDPIDSEVLFDWNSILSQALSRRVEVRRQRYQVERRQLELYAAQLNKRPQLDFVGLYRYQGLGDNLVGDASNGDFDGLFTSLGTGDFQEWQAGVEFVLPVGLRRASVAVSQAQLQLQRERALLAETELRISHDLSDAARNVDLTYRLVETNYNRYRADLRQVEVLQRRYLDGTDNINFLLQAQRSVVQSEVDFYQALANYNLAIRDLHRQKGSLLAYNQVQLAEGAWAPGAQRDAYQKGLFLTPRKDPSQVTAPAPITRREFEPSAIQDSTPGRPDAAAESDAVTSEVPNSIQITDRPQVVVESVAAPDLESADPAPEAASSGE
jgi:outer membrane protein TolC